MDFTVGGRLMRPTLRVVSIPPPARSEGLLVEAVGDETVIYDLETKEAHCLKALAARVFEFADGHRTNADIAEMAALRIGQPVSAEDVADAVSQLEARNLFNTPLAVRNGLSRRDVVRKGMFVGAASAAVMPLISTVTAASAATVTSKIANGNCCGNSATSNCTGGNPTCASGHCCANQPGQSCNQCKCVGDKNDCNTGQCTPVSPNNCPTVTVTNQDGTTSTLTSCGQTSAGKCCYPDATTGGVCCPVVVSGTGQLLNC